MSYESNVNAQVWFCKQKCLETLPEDCERRCTCDVRWYEHPLCSLVEHGSLYNFTFLMADDTCAWDIPIHVWCFSVDNTIVSYQNVNYTKWNWPNMPKIFLNHDHDYSWQLGLVAARMLVLINEVKLYWAQFVARRVTSFVQVNHLTE